MGFWGVFFGGGVVVWLFHTIIVILHVTIIYCIKVNMPLHHKYFQHTHLKNKNQNNIAIKRFESYLVFQFK